MSTKNNKEPLSHKSVFDAFPHPEAILNLPEMPNAIENAESDSAEAIIDEYLRNHFLSIKLPSQVFSEAILKNPAFNSEELIVVAEKILKTSVIQPDAIEDIVSLTYRYIHNPSFKEYIDTAFRKGNEVDPFLETGLINGLKRYSSFPQEIDYIGSPNLFNDCRLVTNIKDLLSIEMLINNYSGKFRNYMIDLDETLEQMMNNKLFLLFMEKPEPTIFKVNKNLYMQWFEIEEVINSNHGEINKELTSKMARQIIKPENQFFFEQNYLNDFFEKDFQGSGMVKNNYYFLAGQELLEELKKTDKTLEIRELKIKDKQTSDQLFQIKNTHITEKTYNQIKMSIRDMFVELEADHHYLLSKIESSGLLNELIRRKSDSLFNFCMASLDEKFQKETRLQKTGNHSVTSDPYEAMFKNLLLKFNMSELTKATHEAGVTAVLTKINKEIQRKTSKEILEAIPDISYIKEFMETKGCFVKTKEELTGYSLFKFLCDRLGVSYFTDKTALLKILREQLNEPAF